MSLLALILGCSTTPAEPPASTREPEPPAFALAVHGGAGNFDHHDAQRRTAIVTALRGVLADGCAALDRGEPSLDVVERIVRELEDHPEFNAGVGAVLTAEGTHELDASIMDGRDLSCGAVGGVTTVKNPIVAARMVMENSRHVLLMGAGAEAFAAEQGLAPVDNATFTTERRTRALEKRLTEEGGGTVGAVALDRDGHLAAATSTGGLTAKRWGRIGDSPIIGAGTYADDRTVAVSGTGRGEEFIRHAVAHTVSTRVGLLDESLGDAASGTIGLLEPGTGGLIAVSHRGEIAMPYNTGGMARGTCRAGGAVQVWLTDAPE